MNVKTILSRLVTSLLLLTGVLLLVWYFYPSNQWMAGPMGQALHAPSFVSVAKAADAAVTATIINEAGISAWYQAPSSINLASIRGQFRTIESETSDYIIGSMPVDRYDESEDVHLYIHKDGWLLAYYLAAEPSGKIFDWQAYENSNGATISTKLENTIAVILGAVGIPFPGATYYDFRYPNATRMMIIAENNLNHDESFTVNLPGSFSYFERSWFIAGGNISLNNTQLGNGYYPKQGILLATQLPTDKSHIITVTSGFGGLVIIYKEQ